ncbi:MAG: hypothetical protein JXN62_11800 [Bacteroidales bacterium]|nr:hypothetical protein [Bacteroidales bacterium]
MTPLCSLTGTKAGHEICGSNKNWHTMYPLLKDKSFAKVLLLLLIIVTTGCDRIQTGEPFTCSTDTKYFLTPSLSFKIDSVSDYRCPKDVLCIWGGDVDLYFNITENRTEIDTVLRLSGGPYLFGDYSFDILEVNPLRNHDQVVDQEDYRINLLIERD